MVPTLINGALMALMTYGNIGAIEFVAIGLAQLLFFTFPIIIGVIVVMLGIERINRVKGAALVVAFIGTAIMLRVSVDAADWRGIALALLAAMSTAVNAILVARYFRGTSVFLATFHFSVDGLLVLLALSLTVGEVRLPATSSGWSGMLGVGILQTIGTPMYLYAIARIGALKTGMATNVQPVAAIALAWFLFGELLTPAQAAGGLLVLGSIAMMQWSDLRNAEPAKQT